MVVVHSTTKGLYGAAAMAIVVMARRNLLAPLARAAALYAMLRHG